MGAASPIASIICTAAQRKVLTAADFQAGSPHYARITGLAFVMGIEWSYDHSSGARHFLELSPDQAKTTIGSPTDTPFIVLPTWPLNQAPGSFPKVEDIPFRNWPYPIACSQLDLYFCTARYPTTSRTFKPSGDIIVTVLYYPSLFV